MDHSIFAIKPIFSNSLSDCWCRYIDLVKPRLQLRPLKPNWPWTHGRSLCIRPWGCRVLGSGVWDTRSWRGLAPWRSGTFEGRAPTRTRSGRWWRRVCPGRMRGWVFWGGNPPPGLPGAGSERPVTKMNPNTLATKYGKGTRQVCATCVSTKMIWDFAHLDVSSDKLVGISAVDNDESLD